MPRRLLVVISTRLATVCCVSWCASRAGDGAEMLLVVPASDLSHLDWLTNAADEARTRASSLRATLDCALERRESRGAHSRGDYPDLDPRLRLNLASDHEKGIYPRAARRAVSSGLSACRRLELDVTRRLLE
jgi:Fumarate reductase flavoprotein C-term